MGIYPNPATTDLTIENDMAMATPIAIYNAIGKQMMRQTISTGKTIDFGE